MKTTSKPGFETLDELAELLDSVRGKEVTIGNGRVKWTVLSGMLDGAGGWTQERGVYPSGVLRLRRYTGRFNENVEYREVHANRVVKVDQ